MLFNTIQFIYFLPTVVILYYVLPHRYRWILLLLASYYFYMSWKASYIFIILGTTVIDFYCAKIMAQLPDKKARRPLLVFSILTNMGLLFMFKYYDFTIGNLNQLFKATGLALEIPYQHFILPVGVSFITFQAVSYTFDVYAGKEKAEPSLGRFALFVAYFPQLVAGPIERFWHLNNQLKAEQTFKWVHIQNGLRLVLFGLFVKMVVADNLSGIVDRFYSDPDSYSGFSALLAMVFYSFQIYSDFFGYSTVASGSALLMGVNLMDNFKTPYLSAGIREFWQRWHISLSTWFRDYLFIPIGGSRVDTIRRMMNILIVFLVSGLWHGASWTFVVWGVLHGLMYIAEDLMKPRLGLLMNSYFKPIKVLITFMLVTVAWVFFRAQSNEEAIRVLSSVLTWSKGGNVLESTWQAFTFTSMLILTDIWLYNSRFDLRISLMPQPIRWLIYSVLLFAVLGLAGVEYAPFIYFQF